MGKRKEKSELREKIGIVIYIIVCFGAGVVFKLWLDGRL